MSHNHIALAFDPATVSYRQVSRSLFSVWVCHTFFLILLSRLLMSTKPFAYAWLL